MAATYIYQRKDGGTTDCYGDIREDSNFSVVCENEENDGIVPGLLPEEIGGNLTWSRVCRYLEENHDARIEEIGTC